MRIVNLKCENCGAYADVNIDNPLAYCPYCGDIIFDFDSTNEVLKEKERTRRAAERTKQKQEETRQKQMEYEYAEHQEKRELATVFLIFAVLIAFALIMYAFSYISSYREKQAHIANNEIQVSASSKELEGENYKDVSALLEEAGFTNITLIGAEDLVLGILSKEGNVDEVSIDGDTSFSSGSWYPADAEVLITYHSFKNS